VPPPAPEVVLFLVLSPFCFVAVVCVVAGLGVVGLFLGSLVFVVVTLVAFLGLTGVGYLNGLSLTSTSQRVTISFHLTSISQVEG